MVGTRSGQIVFVTLGVVTACAIAYRTFVASIVNVVLLNIGLKPIEPFVNSDVLTQMVTLAGLLIGAIGANKFMTYKECIDNKKFRNPSERTRSTDRDNKERDSKGDR